MPDLVIMGSHCVALDAVLGALAEQGSPRAPSRSAAMGGVTAAERGECDLAPVHLVDPATGVYNAHLLRPGLALVKGWQRMQGFVHRPGDARFAGRSAAEAIKAALADRDCLMVNRNAGAGTRVLIDQLLGGARPAGYSNQPRSHNAVAAAVAQGRADWGIAIRSVAAALRPRLPADRAGGLRLPPGRKPPRPAGGAGLPRRAARSRRTRENPRARHAPCRCLMWSQTRDDVARPRCFRPPCGRCLPSEHRRSCAAMAGRCARSRFRLTARKRVSGSFDTSAIRWSLQRNAAEQVLRFHDGAVNAVAFLQDGRIATSGEDARIAIWRPGEPQPDYGARRPQRAGRRARGVARWRDARLGVLGPHGAAVAARGRRAARARGPCAERQRRRASRRTAARWSAPATTRPCASGRCDGGGAPIVATLPAPLNTVAVAPDGEIVTAGADGKVYVLSRRGRAQRRGRGGADADHRGRAVARRQRSSPPPASAARSPSSTAPRASSNARWSGRACRSGRSRSFPTAARCSPAAPTA